METEFPLRDVLLWVLSSASKRGHKKIPLTHIYGAFADLTPRHRDKLPTLVFTKTPYSAYSKRFDEALQTLVGYSVDLPNPSLQFVEVDEAVAARHMDRIAKRYAHTAIESLMPLAADFLDRIEALSQPATHTSGV